MSAPGFLIREIDAPPEALRHLATIRPHDFPALFDSAAEGALGRLTILAAAPDSVLWSDAAGKVHRAPPSASPAGPVPHGFFDALDAWWRSAQLPVAGGSLPFCGGWVVFLSYEAAQDIEPTLALPRSTLPWRALALRTRGALLHDHERRRTLAIAEPGADDVFEQLCDAAAEAAAAPAVRASGAAANVSLALRSIEEEAPEAFLSRVRAAREHIAAGDIYQANLSRPWHIALAAPAAPGRIYRQLCRSNPAPFASLLQWDGFAVLSSSPERLVQAARGRVNTRPIAGTRPRSWRPGQDSIEASALIAHPKERAEHIMLVDLERNDLGKICRAGSVTVDELMTIESYAHVHHIVSSVSGALRAGVTPVDVLRAVFPGGTITGCPKFRCMQIIAALEREGRGAYTGSVGYLSHDGTLDFNILIRTMIQHGERIEFRAGAGIVADSDPERELEETRAKARGLVRAFEAQTPESPG